MVSLFTSTSVRQLHSNFHIFSHLRFPFPSLTQQISSWPSMPPPHGFFPRPPFPAAALHPLFHSVSWLHFPFHTFLQLHFLPPSLTQQSSFRPPHRFTFPIMSFLPSSLETLPLPPSPLPPPLQRKPPPRAAWR